VKGVSSTIIAIVLILSVIGLVLVASTSLIGGEDARAFSHLKRQGVYTLLALAAMLVLMRVDYHKLATLAPWFLAATVLLLAAVLVPHIGMWHNGARRWIRFPLMGMRVGIQPSELAKLTVVLFAAWWLSRSMWRTETFARGLLPVLGVGLLVAGLVVCEPDLGTAILVMCVALVLAVLAGVKLRHLAPVVVPTGAAFGIAVWMMRSDRILAFLDPWAHYSEPAGYHLCQSLMALGSGGLTGIGPGQSRQKLGFLPEIKHDFIYAILGEEMGLIGTGVVLLLFAALVWYGMRVAQRARDLLGFLIASGVTLVIGLQALINIAVVTGSVPTKGISLPFVSLGGSSLVVLMASVGVLLNVARQAEAAETTGKKHAVPVQTTARTTPEAVPAEG